MHFGDINSPKVKVATIGINPSSTEFLIRDTLKPRAERLPATKDYVRSGERCHLSAESHFADAAQRRNFYFVDSQGKQRPHAHDWFKDLEELITGTELGWSYSAKTAVHIDLVACTTTKRWGNVPKRFQKLIKANCADHFQETVAALRDETVLLSNGIAPHHISRSTKQFPLQIEYVEEKLEAPKRPRVKVWKGWLTAGAKGWPFFGWEYLASDLLPDQTKELQRWLRQHCTNRNFKSEISAALKPNQPSRTVCNDDTFKNAIPRR